MRFQSHLPQPQWWAWLVFWFGAKCRWLPVSSRLVGHRRQKARPPHDRAGSFALRISALLAFPLQIAGLSALYSV